jgi:hypothetical protein
LTFDKEGVYGFALDVDGQIVGTLPFQVVLAAQQPQQA